MGSNVYIAIDLKSFYASVECIERNLDPLTTNLVVADRSRTEKTICLAVSPSLKAYGISGRARLFEVNQRLKEINAARLLNAPGRAFAGASYDAVELNRSPELSVSYITATPRMAYYMKYSNRIYEIYLNYIAPEDMHVYSIDEVFIEATHYLKTYGLTARQLAMKMMQDVLKTTGITAAAGIGTNLYLSKIAMDIVAKHVTPNQNGVRIAELDERSYRKLLWEHRPLTDFWRIGRGYARKLEANGLYTMGDIARCSLGKKQEYHNEELLYRLFGVNAELLIDHAWGWEPCTMADIKAYQPQSNCIVSGQVLQSPYVWEKARLVVREMADQLALELVEKGCVTDQIVLTVGYDIGNLTDPGRKKRYKGPVKTDRYGRKVPEHAHGTANLKESSSSSKKITDLVLELYDQIVEQDLLVKRVTIAANHVMDESLTEQQRSETCEQLSLFSDYGAECRQQEEDKEALRQEKQMQQAILDIKKKFGKNAVFKGMNLEEGATGKERNEQIGGHKA